MGLFAWVGSLIDQLVDWLTEALRSFINALIGALKLIWDTAVATVLIATFGLVGTLYVIFYAGTTRGKTIMEVWNPQNMDQASEVFIMDQAPPNQQMPKRGNERVLTLKNWYQ
jgi:hypothetical protein